MRIYIAGPMSKYKDTDYNAPAFRDAAIFLRSLGHDVVTPHERNAIVWMEKKGRVYNPEFDKCDYGDVMLTFMVADDLNEVCTREAIALLPGWEKSKGSLLEVHAGVLLGKRFLDATTAQDISIQVVVKAARFTPPRVTGEQIELFA
jgi:uncharacterized protein DUF4406